MQEQRMVRDLLVPLPGTSGDDIALRAALALAAAHDAHLVAVLPAPLLTSTEVPWGITSPELITELSLEYERATHTRADAVREHLSHETVSWELRIESSRLLASPTAMARQARYTDLSVVCAPGAGEDTAVDMAHFNALLFESGRPVLVVPRRGTSTFSPDRILAAWKPTREATRAVHAAISLFAPRAFDVIVVDAPGDDHGDVEGEPGADIAAHLARHGFAVEVAQRASGTMSIATTLLLHAAERDASLLVAGGFGHSRLREWVLGGTSRELLFALERPVLFAH
jgi:nucleotide-binding universal stress UspA family protein